MIHPRPRLGETVVGEEAKLIRPHVEVAPEYVDLAGLCEREEELSRAPYLVCGRCAVSPVVRGMEIAEEHPPLVGKSHAHGLQDAPFLRPRELCFHAHRLLSSKV